MTPEELWESGQEQLRWTVNKARYRFSAVPIDDLLQSASLGMWKASLEFDESKGVPFSAFAALKMRYEMIYELWRNCVFGPNAGVAHCKGYVEFGNDNRLPMWGKSVNIFNQDKEGTYFEHLLTAIEDGLNLVDNRDFIERIISKLGDYEGHRSENVGACNGSKLIERMKTIARRYYLENLPRETIRHQLGLSKRNMQIMMQEVRNRMLRIAQSLKKEMEDAFER